MTKTNKLKLYIDRTNSSFLLILISFLSSLIYSFLIILMPKFIDNFTSVIFISILVTLIGIIILWVRISDEELFPSLNTIILSTAGIHFALLISLFLLDAPENFLWTIDTYTMHLPGSENITNILNGNEGLRQTTSIWDRIYITHLLTGIAFYFFGFKFIVPSLVLLMGKLLTIFFIFHLAKGLFDKQVAVIAAALFAFSPTILFYTISFYKEAFVQLFTIMIYYFSYLTFEKKNFIFLPLLLLSLALIFIERFYLAPIFLFSIQVYLMTSKKIKSLYKVFFTFIVCLGGVLFLNYYSGAFNIFNILDTLHHFRIAFNSYDSVNPEVNLNLSYSTSVIKLIFTPFLTTDKFAMFFDYSYLLIWGAPLNQLVMLVSTSTMGILAYKNPRKHILYILPFLFFILMYAYIAPYNGRLRDSFYPIIVIYAAYGCVRALNKTEAFFKKKGF